jgi:hypothetical protein
MHAAILFFGNISFIMRRKSTFARQLPLFFCSALLLFGLSAPAWSWDGTGHMLIAQIALDTMPHNVALRIQKKLKPLQYGLPPYNFATASSWMDDIKRDPQNPYPNLSALHYVDIPYSKGASHFVIPAGENAITELQQTIKDLHKSTFDADAQARQWAIVMHLVGDIHQPLHCVDHDDRGGNDVPITGIPDLPENPKTHNLHFFWDTAYRYDVVKGKVRQLYFSVDKAKRPTDLKSGFIAWQAWRLLQKYPPQKMKNYADLNILDWARESYADACDVAYAPVIASGKMPVFLDANYVHHAHEIAARRIVLAGVRLGKLLTKLDAESTFEAK